MEQGKEGERSNSKEQVVGGQIDANSKLTRKRGKRRVVKCHYLTLFECETLRKMKHTKQMCGLGSGRGWWGSNHRSLCGDIDLAASFSP